MYTTILKLGFGLLFLIFANIGLGSISAIISGTWDRAKFWKGIIKGLIVAVALVAVYFAGYLNPDLFIIEYEGESVNLMTAVYMIMLAAFAIYAVDVIKKLKDLLLTSTPGLLTTTSKTTAGSEIEDDASGAGEDPQPVGDEHATAHEADEDDDADLAAAAAVEAENAFTIDTADSRR